MGMRGHLERDVLAACLALLEVRGVLAWRQNTGAMRVGGRLVRFGRPGAPDVAGVLPGGRALFVEVKSARGRVRPEQQAYLDRLTREGAAVAVVRSPGQLEAFLAELGV